MAILPEDIPTGKVTGQYYFVNEDTIEDPDQYPQLTVVTGFVRFKASIKVLRMSARKAVVIPLTFDAKFNSEGKLVPADHLDSPEGILLPATDSTEFDTTGWTWTATFELKDADTGHTIQIDPITFQVPVGSELDLSTIVPAPASPGVITTRGPQGAKGDKGDTGATGPSPTDPLVAGYLSDPVSQSANALSAAIDDSIEPKLDKAEAATTYATNTSVTTELAARVDPLVADAIAADPTVANAAAVAVSDAVAGMDLVETNDVRLPSTVESVEYASVTTDLNGKIAEGITVGGQKFIADAEITKAHIGELEADTFTPAGQSLTKDDMDGYARITVDTLGRVAEDALGQDGRVPPWILSNWSERMAPELSALLGIAPYLKLAAFGDSMTNGDGGGGTRWPTVCADALGWDYYNGGISAQTSTEVALRQGGLEVLVTVTNNSIPASGAVTVTAISPSGSWRAGAVWSFPGTLAGVPGILAKSATEVWTFTRTTAGAAVLCPAGTRFISDTATPHNAWVSVFWVGRNNPTKSIVERDVAAMVASLTPVKPRFLVFPIFNTQGEPAGSSGYINVMAINAALATTYGTNFYDMRRYLIDYGLAAAGITPTAADTTAISEDRIPPSLMSDTIHLTAAGYTVAGQQAAAIITEKGMNS